MAKTTTTTSRSVRPGEYTNMVTRLHAATTQIVRNAGDHMPENLRDFPRQMQAWLKWVEKNGASYIGARAAQGRSQGAAAARTTTARGKASGRAATRIPAGQLRDRKGAAREKSVGAGATVGATS